MLNRLLRVLPLECVFCRHLLDQTSLETKSPWCSICYDAFPKQMHCPSCGLIAQNDQLPCGQCIISPPIWDNFECLSDYIFPYTSLLQALKYKRQFWLASSLAKQLANQLIDKQITPAPYLMAVPMHWKRRLWRGFNHSQLLADALAKEMNVSTIQPIKRIRSTKRQQGLSQKERHVNLKSAFTLCEDIPPHLAIVDDIVTTSTTLVELCNLLRANGAVQIDILAICRTSLKNGITKK